MGIIDGMFFLYKLLHSYSESSVWFPVSISPLNCECQKKMLLSVVLQEEKTDRVRWGALNKRVE